MDIKFHSPKYSWMMQLPWTNALHSWDDDWAVQHWISLQLLFTQWLANSRLGNSSLWSCDRWCWASASRNTLPASTFWAGRCRTWMWCRKVSDDRLNNRKHTSHLAEHNEMRLHNPNSIQSPRQREFVVVEIVSTAKSHVTWLSYHFVMIICVIEIPEILTISRDFVNMCIGWEWKKLTSSLDISRIARSYIDGF